MSKVILSISGMSCSACSNSLEKYLNKQKGIINASVNLVLAQALIEYDNTLTINDLNKFVEKAGFKSLGIYDEKKENKTENKTKELVTFTFLVILVLYISMGHMLKFPVPSILNINMHPINYALTLLALTIPFLIYGFDIFKSGFKNLTHKSPNMDTLVSIGALSSLTYSLVGTVLMILALINSTNPLEYINYIYYESVITIIYFIKLGRHIDRKSKEKTKEAIKELVTITPSYALLKIGNSSKKVTIDEIKKGDILICKPGMKIAVDGTIIEGKSHFDESFITGESMPVKKSTNKKVIAGSLNIDGHILYKAEKIGKDTTISEIVKLVVEATNTKAPIAKIADKVSGIFVPAVITIAVITIIGWLLAGQTVGFALARGISVLVISCPCALGLATPVAIMVGNGVGAKNGILFKTAVSLEEAGKVDIVALDKTGTITTGQPKVTDIFPADGISEKELLEAAFALEKKSEHPLAKAIVEYGNEKKFTVPVVEDFQAVPGNGLTGTLNNKTLIGGNLLFIEKSLSISEKIKHSAEQLASAGKTPLFFAKENRLLGMIAVADVIKEDSPQAIKELKAMGIHVVMLTGDNERTAKAIGKQAGVDHVIAGVLPEGKESVIRDLKEKGKVAMVGDGINDAPALTRADMGIAIGAGTDIAIDAADVVLMKSRLSDVPAAIRLSRATLKNIHENLFLAFIYNIIGIPLAAGAWYMLLGWKLNPMFGAAAMSLSSFCVVTNALRLNLFKMHDASKDQKIKNSVVLEEIQVQNITKQEEKTMKKTMKIEGMMCGHCEAAVKKALESLEGVEEAIVSHEEGTAVVSMTNEVSDDVLTQTVEDKDYKVTEIE